MGDIGCTGLTQSFSALPISIIAFLLNMAPTSSKNDNLPLKEALHKNSRNVKGKLGLLTFVKGWKYFQMTNELYTF